MTEHRIKLRECPREYEVATEDDEFIGKFVIEETWRGMTCLVNKDGEQIIISDDGVADFSQVLELICAGRSTSGVIVRASPDVIAKIKATQAGS